MKKMREVSIFFSSFCTHGSDMKDCDIIKVWAEGELEDFRGGDPILDLHGALVHD